MYYNGILQNITEQRKAEEAVIESDEKHRFLADNSIDTIWQMDLRLKFTYVSSSVYTMSGFTKEEWIGSYLYQHATRKEFVKMAREAIKALKNYKTFKHVVFEAKMLKKMEKNSRSK